MDVNKLLEQFMGSTRSDSTASTSAQDNSPIGGMLGGGFGKGAAVGGLLGLLLGNKKMRKMAGGAIGYGGAAAAGAMAYKAFQNWQQGKQVQTAPVVTPADLDTIDQRFLPQTASASAGQNFSLTLVSAMIAAAKADGHIDAQEQAAIFDKVEKMSLDAESKAFVFDALRKPVDVDGLVANVQGIEQASEVYLVSRVAIDIDQPAERVYLQVLAHRLNLPAELVAHLDHQVADA